MGKNLVSNTVVTITRKYHDLSFSTLFKKEISKNIIKFLIISILLLVTFHSVCSSAYEDRLKCILSNSVVQFIDEEESNDEDFFKGYKLNQILAKAYDEITQDDMTKTTFIEVYNLTDGKFVNNSLNFIELKTDISEWWNNECKESIDIIPVSIPEALTSFVNKYHKKDLKINQLCYSNGETIVEELVALEKDGSVVDTYTSTPNVSTSAPRYTEAIEFEIIGNGLNNKIYINAINSITVDNDELGIKEISYPTIITDNYKKHSIEYTNNGKIYTLNCFYEYSFITGNIIKIIFVEVLLALYFGISAFIRAKTVSEMYN